MKNRINFLRDDLKPKIILINLNFVAFMAVVSISIIIAGLVWTNQQFKNSQQTIETLMTQVEQKKFQADALREAKDSRTQDKSIVAEIQTIQAELDVKMTILNELENRESQRSNGFSKLMIDLAANHQPSLWLTNISVDERKLLMQGTTADSSALPKWLSKLNSAPYFSGKEFAGARLNRNDKEMLNFVLSSELDDVKGDGK